MSSSALASFFRLFCLQSSAVETSSAANLKKLIKFNILNFGFFYCFVSLMMMNRNL